jgi:hypothetical protein
MAAESHSSDWFSLWNRLGIVLLLPPRWQNNKAVINLAWREMFLAVICALLILTMCVVFLPFVCCVFGVHSLNTVASSCRHFERDWNHSCNLGYTGCILHRQHNSDLLFTKCSFDLIDQKNIRCEKIWCNWSKDQNWAACVNAAI